MSDAYVSVIDTPEGCFLRIAKPGQTPEDYPLSAERKASIAAACSSSLQADIQRARGRVEERWQSWMARDAAAG